MWERVVRYGSLRREGGELGKGLEAVSKGESLGVLPLWERKGVAGREMESFFN